MPRVQARCQQSKRWNDRKVNIVSYADESRSSFTIKSRNGAFIARIHFPDARVFIDDLRLVIAHPVDLVRNFVEVRSSNDHPNQFCAAELNLFSGIAGPGYSDRICCTSLICVWVKGQLSVQRWT